jgi:flagellar basal-body rod modification protein FlgD
MEVNGATSGARDSAYMNTTQQKQTLGKEAFLQLLVAQVKNQNPLNPTDGVQFLSQLAQFSQLEQLMGIREDLAGVAGTNNPNTSGDD